MSNENEMSFMDQVNEFTLSFKEFIESAPAVLLTIILTSFVSLLHIGFGYYVANNQIFIDLFGEYQMIGIGIAIFASMIFDFGLVVFSANTKSKTYIVLIASAIVYLNYVAFQFHQHQKMEIHSWNSLHAIWSFLPVLINVLCVFEFHKKTNVVSKTRNVNGGNNNSNENNQQTDNIIHQENQKQETILDKIVNYPLHENKENKTSKFQQKKIEENEKDKQRIIQDQKELKKYNDELKKNNTAKKRSPFVSKNQGQLFPA